MATFAQLFLVLIFPLTLALSIARQSQEHGATPGPTIEQDGVTYVGVTDAYYAVDVWRGIRYASPPGRLQPAGPIRQQPGTTVDAGQFGSSCYQVGSNHVGQSEDCLFLNIYRPAQASLKGHQDLDNLPVMFWIHGGGFNTGSSNIYEAESLANRSAELGSPTIFVTINYRLSFLGFSAGTEVIAHNALNLGLLDQRQALQWVHENIANFGGDPCKVTIFGQSAGATSVGLHMIAYDGQHEDLFRGAILESGSPADTSPTPPATWPRFQEAWDSVVKAIGCLSSPDIWACVQKTPEQALFSAVDYVNKALAPLPSSTDPWQPVIDGTFLTDFPSKLIAEGKFVKVPIIIGFTTDELTYVIPLTLNISSDVMVAYLAKSVIPWVPDSTIQAVVALDPLSAFPNTCGQGGTHWKQTAAIASDIFEKCPGRAFIRNVSEHAAAWKYRWNAALPAQLAAAPCQGVVHAADVPYIYGTSITPYINAADDIALSRIAQQAWISFAAYLNPNKLGDLGSPGVTWPHYHDSSEHVLVFQTKELGGLHTEKDPDDRPVCDFIIGADSQFVRR